MQFIRGTTPSIVITVKTELDLHQIAEVWIYVSQQNKVKVDKQLTDVTFDYAENTMTIKLSQEDTLALKEGEALFQIRVLMMDGTALATLASKVDVKPVYKGGVISEEDTVSEG